MKNRPAALLCYPSVGSHAPFTQYTPTSVWSVASAFVEAGGRAIICDQRITDDWRTEVDQALSSSDLVCAGISTMSGPQITHAVEMAVHIRRMDPGLPLVWGGVHPSLLPEQTLQHDLVDMVIVGEGETTFSELVFSLQDGHGPEGVAGCAYRDKNGVFHQEARRPFIDLDSIPTGRYELIDGAQYRFSDSDGVRPVMSIETSRGCPHKCGFCYNIEFHKHTWRGRSPQNVVAQILDLAERGYQDILLHDDNVFHDMERVRQICRSLIDKDVSFRFHHANCRIDQARKFTREDLDVLRQSGLGHLFLGIESGSLTMARAIGKGHSPEDVMETILRLVGAGLRLQVSFILGFPGETEEDMAQTLALMERLKSVPNVTVPGAGFFLPFPGTPLHDAAISSGWSPPQELEDWGRITEVDPSDWLGPEKGRIAHRAAFISTAIDTTTSPRSSRTAELLRRLYSPAARLRARKRRIRHVPEFDLLMLGKRSFSSHRKNTN